MRFFRVALSYWAIAFFIWRNSPQWARASSFMKVVDHTERRATVGRTPLDELLARRRDLYLTTHNSHNRQTSMTPVGFEPTLSAGERPYTYTLDRAAGNYFSSESYGQTQGENLCNYGFKTSARMCTTSEDSNVKWTYDLFREHIARGICCKAIYCVTHFLPGIF